MAAAAATCPDSPVISVRVVNVDWYLSEEQLPVVRIFGSTPPGQRACLHLHGALPYFMIRPMQDENPAVYAQFTDPSSLRTLLPQLEYALESAMAASSGGPGAPSLFPVKSHSTGEAGAAIGAGRGGRSWQRNRQRVLARLEVVRGVPFYGYHGEEKLFVKVYVNNPAMTGKVASVLQAGHVMSTRFQPYESHVPFLLQVFIDYNISGMSYVHLRNALFLQPLPELSSMSSSQQPDSDSAGFDGANPSPFSRIFTSATVPETMVANPMGQCIRERSHASLRADKETAGLTAHRTGSSPSASEAAQDLLDGISMSQLFSQPSSPPEDFRSRPSESRAAPAPGGTSLSEKLPEQSGAQGGVDRSNPPPKWWERQTTTELEVTAIVDDVINTKLLTAGGADGGKPMAVASLSELWDEEKERSRMAGGGSQLSAPPGLELADSQNVWEPPEGLLTQHVRGEVEGLARNVLQRAMPPHEETGNSSQQEEHSQHYSQASTDGDEVNERSDKMELTPSGDRSISAPGASAVPDASSPPANYLPLLGGREDDVGDLDQGLLDLVTALRGSQQSQGNDEESHFCSSIGQECIQTPPETLSQRPVFTPESSADQLEAVAATQKKQERDEQELEHLIALAAQSERHYDSDGSDHYHGPAERTDTAADRFVRADVATSTDTRVTGGVGIQTPVVGSPPPWSSSQRTGSYPPWSQRSARVGATRAATLPFWSQRSAEVASAGLSERLGASGRCGGSQVEPRGDRQGLEREGQEEEEEEEGEEEEEEEEDTLEDGAMGRMLSQLSARSLGDVEGSVQAEVERERRVLLESGSAHHDSMVISRAPGFEPSSQSELVDIICSQVEVEQEQVTRSAQADSFKCVTGEEDAEDPEDEEEEAWEKGIARTRRKKAYKSTSEGSHRWTRGPTRLQYDMDEKEEEEGEQEDEDEEEEEEEVEEVEEENRTEGDDADARGAGDKGPLRLRGGVGLHRTRAKPPRPSRSATAPTPTRSSSSSPNSSLQSVAETLASNPSAGSKRSTPGGLPQRQAPPRAPVGLRRSSSLPGWGDFKPPRLLPNTAKLDTIGHAAGGGGSADRGGDGNEDESLAEDDAARAAAGGPSGDSDSNDGDSSRNTQEEGSNTEERSQVVVPGWGSQGHHPVEYSESQLNFVTTAQLRTSPKLNRGMGARTGSKAQEDEGNKTARKKPKLIENGGPNRDHDTDTPLAASYKRAPAASEGNIGVAAGSMPIGSGSVGDAGERSGLDALHPGSDIDQGGVREKLVASPTPAPGAPLDQTADSVQGQGSSMDHDAAKDELESKWRSADARLRLVRTRDTSPSLLHYARPDSEGGGKNAATGGSGLGSSMPSPAGHHSPGLGQIQSETELPGDHTNPVGDAAIKASSLADYNHALDTVDGPLHAQRDVRDTEAGSLPKAPKRGIEQDKTTDNALAGPTHASISTPTNQFPPALGWGRLPATPLSAHSDNSDMPPLGQPSPRMLAVATMCGRAADATAPPGSSSNQREQGGENNRAAGERSPYGPGHLSLTSGTGSTMGSPMRDGFSGFTPPTPRPPRGDARSGTVVLQPLETAPDPADCAATLTKLGIPQVVHTEPYYSRKDDVPDRPREFAGNVFRILHKDDLQTFDTLPSRELLRDYRVSTASADTPISSQCRHASHTGSSPRPSRAPRSQASDLPAGDQEVGEVVGGVLTVSSSSGHPTAGMNNCSGVRHDGGRDGWESSGAFSWRSNDARQQPVTVRGINEWKNAAATGITAGARFRLTLERPQEVFELVPAFSPPTCKDVAAWGRANPSSARVACVVDDLDKPALKSTRNALGVLAGGGEADLVDHQESGEMSMVADPNTGQLVPALDATAVPPPPTPTPPTPRTTAASRPPVALREGLRDDSSTRRPQSHFSSTPEAPPVSRPSFRTPESASSLVGHAALPRPNDLMTPDQHRNGKTKLSTQGSHRPTSKSQISPTTQTPSSCVSEGDGGKFAFGLRAADHNAGGAAAGPTAGASQNESQTSEIGLTGSIRGRDRNDNGAGGGVRGDRLTVLSLELHVQVGANRRPDPRRDLVHAICWRMKDTFTSAEHETTETRSGVIVLPLSTTAARGTATYGARRPEEGGSSGGSSGDSGGGDGERVGGVPFSSRKQETCVKCGEPRDEAARNFCSFDVGGFLGLEMEESGGGREGAEHGVRTFRHGLGKDVEVLEVCSEEQVFRGLVGVFYRHDPDFVVGWEVQGDSLGYVVERGFNMEPSMDMARLLSRTPGRDADKRNSHDEWGKTHGSGIWLTGRTVLNMWRLMRSELKLCSYTLQSVAEHVLRKRIPSFSLHLRSRWFSGRDVAARSRALADPLRRAAASIAIMDKLDLLGRTSEMARLFGIDFFSVLSRGSQYRVEAVMLRVLKPHNFVAVSPSRQQVAGQAAMESIPLVFEPHSRFYTSPVVVLDFQSLYPSMMIAYNLCYTTILGKFDSKTGGTSGSLGVLPYSEESTSAALRRAAEAHQAWEKRDEPHGQGNDRNSGDNRNSSRSSKNSPTPAKGRVSPSRLGLSRVDEKAMLARADRTEASGPSITPPTMTAAGVGTSPSPEVGRRNIARGASSQPARSASESFPTQYGMPGGGKTGWDPRCIHLAPNTAGFCHPSLRQGILPLMLREILETRVMIKGAMRRAEAAGQRVLARTLNARQFALKMISNVTYGYTAAGFSGRMPMAELADAIVESGRQTLIAAAKMVDDHGAWQASVVYGDTDSLFIELKGRSLEEAHRIGKEMAATVTRSCPPDVVLKFEKVYLPCILASKKRYVGHMYESPKDLRPSFDAKGIETVRRDGCPLLVKMLEKVLRLLFTTKDLSQVKGYLYRQWTRILTDRAAVGDFIFAKEVRLGTYASDVYMPPSAIVASKAMANDPRAEPKYCERIPYVVVAGPVGARLMDLVVSPEQFLAEGSGLRLNGKYYITKVINPALDRALALLGVDVSAWYNDMPRPAPRVSHKAKNASGSSDAGGARTVGSGGGGGAWGGGGQEGGGWKRKGRGGAGKATMITNFFISDRCLLCGEQCARSVCAECAREPSANCVAFSRLRESELASTQLLEVCRQCTGHSPAELFGPESCGSLECPVFFERHRAMLRRQDECELCDALGLLAT